MKENEYVFISRIEIIKFATEDKITGYIFNVSNNMITYPVAFRKKTYFLSGHYRFNENEKNRRRKFIK